MKRGVLVLFTLVLSSFPSMANAQSPIDLFEKGDPELLTVSIASIKDTSQLYDNNASTAVQIDLASEPVDFVFGFKDKTVTASRLRVTTKGLAKDSVEVEILVSTISATEGYRTLRSSFLRESGRLPQELNFVDSAAKWVIVRFTPLKPNTSFSLCELDLLGFPTEPATFYKFDDSPTEAFEVFSQLSSTVDVSISEEEKAMFEDAKDGTFDDISFAEASLLSNGVIDSDERKQYLDKINRLADQLSQSANKSTPPFERGEALFNSFTNRHFKKGMSHFKQTYPLCWRTRRLTVFRQRPFSTFSHVKWGSTREGLKFQTMRFRSFTTAQNM
jgi:hypothetical protein